LGEERDGGLNKVTQKKYIKNKPHNGLFSKSIHAKSWIYSWLIFSGLFSDSKRTISFV